jgi:hypothetical protein
VHVQANGRLNKQDQHENCAHHISRLIFPAPVGKFRGLNSKPWPKAQYWYSTQSRRNLIKYQYIACLTRPLKRPKADLESSYTSIQAEQNESINPNLAGTPGIRGQSNSLDQLSILSISNVGSGYTTHSHPVRSLARVIYRISQSEFEFHGTKLSSRRICIAEHPPLPLQLLSFQTVTSKQI